MKNDFQKKAGSPLPLGSTLTARGINFSLFSRHAQAVTLVIAPNPERSDWIEIPLEPRIHKTGDIWHILLADASAGLRYGYRISGPNDPSGIGTRLRLHPHPP